MFQPWLFPDAETGEDSVEKVVGVDGTDHFAELLEGEPDFESEEFRGVVKQCKFVGMFQMVDPFLDVVLAPAKARCKRRFLVLFGLFKESVS